MLRSMFSVSFATLLSRILGFLRDMLLASSLGSGFIADAFVVAFRFPNLFRRIFAEGAFNAAFIPILSSQENKQHEQQFINNAVSLLLFSLIFISALILLFMPAFLTIIAPGFSDNPQKEALTIDLARICFPYLLFLSLGAAFMGILNSNNKFTLAAYAPILLNIILVPLLLFITNSSLNNTETAGYLISIGVFIAGFLQMAWLYYGVKKLGYKFTIKKPVMDDDLKKFIKLGVPGVIAGSITQINIVVGTVIASLTPGAVSYLYYADRLYQLPLGLIGIALGVVLLPTISNLIKKHEFEKAIRTQNKAIDISLFLSLPAMVGLIVLNEEIILTLFERGAFTSSDTLNTAKALLAFSLGIPAFIGVKVFSPMYFARQNTKTPMIYGIITVVVNIVLSLMLFPIIGFVGVALASSISGWVNIILLILGLRKIDQLQIPKINYLRWLGFLIAALLMGLMIYTTLETTLIFKQNIITTTSSNFLQAIYLTFIIASGLVIYVSSIFMMRVFNLSDIKRLFKK